MKSNILVIGPSTMMVFLIVTYYLSSAMIFSMSTLFILTLKSTIVICPLSDAASIMMLAIMNSLKKNVTLITYGGGSSGMARA